MKVKMVGAILMENRTVEPENGKPFQSVEIVCKNGTNNTDKFKFIGSVKELEKLPVLEPVDIEAEVGGYVKGYEQRLTIRDVVVKNGSGK